MGQYYVPVSIDSEEFLHPHELGSGLKALEIASTNVPQLVQYLTTQTTGAGGGDFRIPEWADGKADLEYFGRWAGDRVVYAGDYDETNLGLTDEETELAETYRNLPHDERGAVDINYANLFGKTEASFTNISESARAEYNAAVDHVDYQIRDNPWERETTFTAVGIHPDDPRTLGRGLDWEGYQEAAAAYDYGRKWVERVEDGP